MQVTVICYGPLRDHLPRWSDGRRAEIEVPEGATVSDVAAALHAPGRIALALIDGEPAPLDQMVAERAEITFMPPFSGGTQGGPEHG